MNRARARAMLEAFWGARAAGLKAPAAREWEREMLRVASWNGGGI